jgi:hypothetical protein
MKRVVLRSHGRLSSLGWLVLAFGFGAPFLVVGLQSEARTANFLVGIPLLAFFAGLAFWDLGRSDVLVLDAGRRRGRFSQGHYRRRTTVEFDFEEVTRVVLVTSQVATARSGRATFFDLRLERRDGQSFTLDLGRRPRAADDALLVGRALGRRIDRETRSAAAP